MINKVRVIAKHDVLELFTEEQLTKIAMNRLKFKTAYYHSKQTEICVEFTFKKSMFDTDLVGTYYFSTVKEPLFVEYFADKGNIPEANYEKPER